jgi:hypothetical protein
MGSPPAAAAAAAVTLDEAAGVSIGDGEALMAELQSPTTIGTHEEVARWMQRSPGRRYGYRMSMFTLRLLQVLILYPACAIVVVVFLLQQYEDMGPLNLITSFLGGLMATLVLTCWCVGGEWKVLAWSVPLCVLYPVIQIIYMYVLRGQDHKPPTWLGAAASAGVGFIANIYYIYTKRRSLETVHKKGYEVIRKRERQRRLDFIACEEAAKAHGGMEPEPEEACPVRHKVPTGGTHKIIDVPVGTLVIWNSDPGVYGGFNSETDTHSIKVLTGCIGTKSDRKPLKEDPIDDIMEDKDEDGKPVLVRKKDKHTCQSLDLLLDVPTDEEDRMWTDIMTAFCHRCPDLMRHTTVESSYFYAGVYTQLYSSIFESFIWVLQGAFAFGLAFRYQLAPTLVSVAISIPWVRVGLVALGYDHHDLKQFGSTDASAASSEVLYPAIVYLFLALLRSWEKEVSVEGNNLLHENDGFLMQGYLKMLVLLSERSNKFPATRWDWFRRRCEEAKLTIMRQEILLTHATNHLELMDTDLTQSINTTDDWMQIRLWELKTSLIKGFVYPKFETDQFATKMRTITSKKKVEMRATIAAEKRATKVEVDESDAARKPVIKAIIEHRVGLHNGIKCVDIDCKPVRAPQVCLNSEGRVVKCDSGSYLRSSDIVRLIILCSKADQVIMHGWCWWSVVFTSLLHAALPLLWSMRESCVPRFSNRTDVQEQQCTMTENQVTQELRQAKCDAVPHCRYHETGNAWYRLDSDAAIYSHSALDNDAARYHNSTHQESCMGWEAHDGHDRITGDVMCRGTLVLSVASLLIMFIVLFSIFHEAWGRLQKADNHILKPCGVAITKERCLAVIIAVILSWCIGYRLILGLPADNKVSFQQLFVMYSTLAVPVLLLAVYHEASKHTLRAKVFGGAGVVLALTAMECVFGGSAEHSLGFLLSYWLTFSVTIRLSKCFEDVYEKYRRMLYFLHLTPWSTLKQHRRVQHFGVLPEFGLNSVTNIESWNRMRIFLERYDNKWDRERQLAVVWMLVAWVGIAAYQVAKYINPLKNSFDTETILAISSTFQLAIGISLILYWGNRTNEIQSIGFEHCLRIKQAETMSTAIYFAEQYKMYSTHEDPKTEVTDRLQPDRQPPQIFYLIETLIESLRNEHLRGNRTHWGAEDRRATLRGLVMDNRMLWAFLSSVFTVMAPAMYKAFHYLYVDEIHREIFDVNDNITSCEEYAREILYQLKS